MKTYKTPKMATGGLRVNNSKTGQTMENKVEKIVHNKEPIKDSAPILHTDRKHGVVPSTNIRTDRWEIAVDATDKATASYQARRDANGKEKGDGEAEPTQGESTSDTSK